MSGDVQPRKRKDKRKKKDEEEAVLQHHGSIGGGGSDEVIHVHKESKLGGNIVAKIVFFGLLGALGVMVGLIIIEYHGTNDVETQSAADSPWSVMLEGWVDDSAGDHDDHDEHPADDEHGDEHDDHDDQHDHHEEEFSEGEHDEETEDEAISESFVQQTYEDLKAAYNQLTPDASDTEQTEDYSAKTDDYPRTESEPEPEPSESEAEGEEEEEQEDDPFGQWKSENGPKLLAKEVEEVQTGSEDETEEESSDEAPVRPGGPNSSELEDVDATATIISGQDESAEPSEIEHDEIKEESIEEPEQTNEADWEINEALDEAEKELDEGDFPV